VTTPMVSRVYERAGGVTTRVSTGAGGGNGQSAAIFLVDRPRPRRESSSARVSRSRARHRLCQATSMRRACRTGYARTEGRDGR
jgi:hypothetical protein